MDLTIEGLSKAKRTTIRFIWGHDRATFELVDITGEQVEQLVAENTALKEQVRRLSAPERT